MFNFFLTGPITRLTLGILLLSSTLLSCMQVRQPEFLSVEKIKFEKIGLNATTLSADLHFFNPNSFGLTMGKAELDIYMDQSSLGHISKDELISIPRKSKFVVPISFEIDMKQLLLTGLKTQVNGKSQIRVVGSVIVKKGGLQKRVAVDYSLEKDMSLFK